MYRKSNLMYLTKTTNKIMSATNPITINATPTTTTTMTAREMIRINYWEIINTTNPVTNTLGITSNSLYFHYPACFLSLY